jgi:hypothetical protein
MLFTFLAWFGDEAVAQNATNLLTGLFGGKDEVDLWKVNNIYDSPHRHKVFDEMVSKGMHIKPGYI